MNDKEYQTIRFILEESLKEHKYLLDLIEKNEEPTYTIYNLLDGTELIIDLCVKLLKLL